MRPINLIVVHCTASPFGTAALVDKWHKDRWPDRTPPWIGYHYLVSNGWPVPKRFEAKRVGLIEQGCPLERIGAHAQGHNAGSIGVCLVGPPFHDDQITSAVELVAKLCATYGLDPATQVKGHRELPNVTKECPVIDMGSFRSQVLLHRETRIH